MRRESPKAMSHHSYSPSDSGCLEWKHRNTLCLLLTLLQSSWSLCWSLGMSEGSYLRVFAPALSSA